jgi:hypothetical protein
VAIHGVAEVDGLPYFVMPYSRGESLQKRLDRVGALSVTEILRISLQTARGLAAAHAQGLVHRDVKPANILLDEGVERVLLTDFGLARAVDDATLTRSGVIAGTPQYMSPEQIRAEGVDTRSDLFSLGATIYAMCTGRAPFRAESTYAILRQITDEEAPSLADVNPAIPDWLSRIVSRLMSKDPSRRFSSARELADLLEACLANLERSPEMPLSESRFGNFGIVFVLPDDLDDEPDEWPERILRRLTGAYSGPIREFVRSRGGIAVGILTMLTMAAIGLVIGTEPPELAGTWHGEDWGTVKLEAKSPGTLEGTFDDTVNGQPGKLKLQWSRVERRFVGDWKEGDVRFGKISVRLDGDAIRGAITTDPDSKVNPGTPALADLAWFRGSANEIVASDIVRRKLPSREFARDSSVIERKLAIAKADLAPFQGRWEVAEVRVSGQGKDDKRERKTIDFEGINFQGNSITFEAKVEEDDKTVEKVKSVGKFDVLIVDRKPEEVQGKILILTPVVVGKKIEESDFKVTNDKLELKFELKPDDSTASPVQTYSLRLVPTQKDQAVSSNRLSLAQPDLIAGMRKRADLNLKSSLPGMKSNEPFTAGKDGATEIARFNNELAAVEGAVAEGVIVIDGKKVTLTSEAQAGGGSVTFSGAGAKPGADVAVTSSGTVVAGEGAKSLKGGIVKGGSLETKLKGTDKGAKAKSLQPDKAALAKAGTTISSDDDKAAVVSDGVLTFSFEDAQAAYAGSTQNGIFFDAHRSFPDDYRVVHAEQIKPSTPSLTLKARWVSGDTETIRTIKVELSKPNSTALVRLNPLRSVTWNDSKSDGTVDSGKDGSAFSLMQFELLPDKSILVKCWAAKPARQEGQSDAKPADKVKNLSRTYRYYTGADIAKKKSDSTATEANPFQVEKKPSDKVDTKGPSDPVVKETKVTVKSDVKIAPDPVSNSLPDDKAAKP